MNISFLKRKSTVRTTRQVFSLTLAVALTANSLLAGMPIFNTPVAEAATIDVCDSGCTYSDITSAIDAATNGDIITVGSDQLITSTVIVNKEVTLDGLDSAAILTNGANHVFVTTAANVVIKNFNFIKTDKTSQNLINIQGTNTSILNNDFVGQYVLGDGEVARAIEVSTTTGVNISDNTFNNLRQPAYVNDNSTGQINNNYVNETRGWVLVANTNFTFNGNTWGTNAVDIAFIPGTPNNYSCMVMQNIAAANNNPNIDNQSPYDPCPEIVNVDAYYVNSNYKGIGVDIKVDNLIDATGVTVTVERASGANVVKTNKVTGSVLGTLNTGNIATVTAPIVIENGTYIEANSSSWNPAPAIWDTTTTPTAIIVTITRAGGPDLVKTVNAVGETLAVFSDTVPPYTCSVDSTTFDPFQVANVNGQGDWQSTGSFDQSVVSNNYGFPTFGCKSFRLSNAVTSGSFGNQTFSYSTANEAGETDAVNAGMSGGTRQNHFEAQFDIASTLASQQPGMSLSVSPDRGDGARMSYLRFDDQAEGIHVYFDDVTSTSDPAVWNEVDIATLDRTAPHTIKFVIDFVDGPSNDVVQIYIDGVLKHTGTTWENYYRFDDESNPTLADESRTVDSLLFRAGGTAAPANSGNGFLFDNVELSTSSILPDTDGPTAPTINAPVNESYHSSTPIKAIWTAATDDSSITNYQVAYRYDDGHTFGGSTCPVGEIVDGQVISGCRTIGNVLSRNHVPNVSEQGGVTIWVRAIDEYGNEGDWSEPVHYFYDETAPTVSGVVLNGQNVTVARTVNCGSTDFNLVSGKIDLNATISDNIDVHNARYKIRKVTNGGCTQTAIYQSNTVNMQDSGSNQWITLPGAQIDTATAVGLVDGNYTIQITAKDEAGNMSTSYVDITVDNTAPDKVEGIQIEFNGQNRQCAGFINGRTITVNWNDSNEPGVVYEYHNKDRSLLNNLTESEFTGDIRDQDGFYQYKVRAIDAAGNAGEWSDWCGVTLDREAPVAPTLTSPDNAAVVNGMSISQSWSTTDTDIDHYIYESYNDELGHNLRWHETFNSTSKTAFNVSESTYWWRVQAVDNAGNVGPWSAMWKITVDNTVPTVEVTTHEDGDVISGLVTVIGLVNDSNPGHNWFVVTDEDGNQVAGIGVNNDTTPSFDWNTVSVSDGLYIIKLEARDAAGNKDPNGTGLVDDNGISVDWTVVTVDNTNPVVTVDLDDTTINTDDSDNPSVTISATDATSGVDYVQYKVMDESGDTVLGWVTIDNNTPTEVPGVLGLADGEYTLRARAFDSAGNKKSGADISFTVDNTIPALTLASIDSNSDASRTITGTGEPEASIMVEVHSTPQTWNGTIAGDGTWSHTFTGLEEGSHTVNATSTDAAGNISMQSSTFTVLAAVNTNTGGQTLGAKDSRNTTPTPTEAKKAGSVLAAITELPGTGAATSAFAFVGALTLMAGAALALRRRKTS